MPVILDHRDWAKWLGEEAAELDEVLAIAKKGSPAERMTMHPVSNRVNTPRNDDPALLDDVA
jgi:putative SOS response-associated peptidase YedK